MTIERSNKLLIKEIRGPRSRTKNLNSKDRPHKSDLMRDPSDYQNLAGARRQTSA